MSSRAEPVTRGDAVRVVSTQPGDPVARASYTGPYDGTVAAWSELMAAIAAAGKAPTFPVWEVYTAQLTPDLDPATLRTDLYTLVADAGGVRGLWPPSA